MIFTEDNLQSCRAKPLAAYEEWHNDLSARDFRTLSLSLAGPPSAPLYTSVMVKRDPPFAGKSYPKLSRAELEGKIAELAKQVPPLHPYIVTATGPQGKAVYAACFRKMAAKPIFVADLPGKDMPEVREAQRLAGNMLISVDAFGTADNIRYCTLWSVNGGRLAWNADALNDIGKPGQQRFDAMVAVGARPALVALTPAGGLAALYVDDRLTQIWSMTAAMSAAEMKTRMAEELKHKRFPVRIGSATVGAEVRFVAIFAATDDIVARKFRPSISPAPIGLSAGDEAKVQKIDDWMEAYLTTNNIRGGALAIVMDRRLVYARGYTYAEPAPFYDDVLPTTLFRLASVSKLFTAVAVWKGLAAHPTKSRNSLMHELLGLDEGAARTTGFKTVKIRHLLESNSGIEQRSNGNILDAARDTGAKQPLTGLEIATAIAATPMAGVPGAMLTDGPSAGQQATSYGKTDYILLGRVAAWLAGTPDFDSALKKLVLDPLHMTRTRGSRARSKDREPDEARHHTPALETSDSEMHAESPRRIVPAQYEGANCDVYDGAGGVSAAAVDVARLGAMLACRTGNPVLTLATLDAMLADAVAATMAGSKKGYHGFDKASGASPTVTYEKGGTLGPSVGAGINGTTGQLVVVVLRNGGYLPGGVTNWDTAIPAIAKTVNWGTGDLFPDPQYGMPSL